MLAATKTPSEGAAEACRGGKSGSGAGGQGCAPVQPPARSRLWSDRCCVCVVLTMHAKASTHAAASRARESAIVLRVWLARRPWPGEVAAGQTYSKAKYGSLSMGRGMNHPRQASRGGAGQLESCFSRPDLN